MTHFNHFKFFSATSSFYWPTSTTSRFLLTHFNHFNHFKFFSDPIQPLQVFQWSTSRFSVPLQVFIDPLQPLQGFYWPTSTTSTTSGFSVTQLNHFKFSVTHFKFFSDTSSFYWPTSTTSSFSATHFNHFKFFSDPLQPLQVFQWPT